MKNKQNNLIHTGNNCGQVNVATASLLTKERHPNELSGNINYG